MKLILMAVPRSKKNQTTGPTKIKTSTKMKSVRSLSMAVSFALAYYSLCAAVNLALHIAAIVAAE